MVYTTGRTATNVPKITTLFTTCGEAQMQELLLIVLLVLAIAWLVVRLRQRKADAVEAKKPRKTDPRGAFHAVSLQYSANACTAAKEMTGRRFLSSAAPRLPLPGCDNLECRCQFSHHADRREGQDRRSPFGSRTYGGTTGSYQRERRERTDRRKGTSPKD